MPVQRGAKHKSHNGRVGIQMGREALALMCYECGPAQYLLTDLLAVGLLAAVFIGGWLSAVCLAWRLLNDFCDFYDM